MIFSLKCLLYFRSQLSENTIVGISVVVAALTLVHQGDINQRHERYGMLALLTLRVEFYSSFMYATLFLPHRIV